MKKTTPEASLLHRLKAVSPKKFIGLCIKGQFDSKGDEALSMVVQQLRSQAKDNPASMERALGWECYKQLIRYVNHNHRIANCRRRLLTRLPAEQQRQTHQNQP